MAISGTSEGFEPATVYKDLRNGMKLAFSQSHEETGYAGEATIRRIAIGALRYLRRCPLSHPG